MLNKLLAAIMLLCAAAASGAQAVYGAPGRVRDAAVHPESGDVWLALYDRALVERRDANTGERLAAIATGEGPAALAFSADGEVLACVNSLDDSVTFIDTDANEVVATLPAGEGPCAVTALPGGGFAVANAFSDNVTLLDPGGAGVLGAISSVSSVPVAIAASRGILAVATRAPAAVHLYAAGAAAPERIVALPETPRALAVLPEGEFIAATDAGLLRIDPARGTTSVLDERAALDAAVSGAAIYGVMEARVVAFVDGAEATAWNVPETVRVVAAGAGIVAAAVPTAPEWIVLTHEAPASAPVAARGPEPQPALAPAALPIEQEAAKPDAPAEAPPAPAPMVQEEAAAPIGEPEQEAASPRGMEPEEAPAAAVPPQPPVAPVTEPAPIIEEAEAMPIGAEPEAGEGPDVEAPEAAAPKEAGSPGPTIAPSGEEALVPAIEEQSEEDAPPAEALPPSPAASDEPPGDDDLSGAAQKEEAPEANRQEVHSEPSGQREVQPATGEGGVFRPAPDDDGDDAAVEESASSDEPIGSPQVRRAPLREPSAKLPPAARPDSTPAIDSEPISIAEGLSAIPEVALRPGGFAIPDLTEQGNWRATDFNYDAENDVYRLAGDVELIVDDTTFQADEVIIDQNETYLHAIGNVVVEQEESRLEADELFYDLGSPAEGMTAEEDAQPRLELLASGNGAPEDPRIARGAFYGTNVNLTEPDRELQAQSLAYDFVTETGEAVNARGRAGAFYFAAAYIKLLGPESLEADQVWITTCDCDSDYYKVHFEHLSVAQGTVITGEDLQLEVLGLRPPISWPKWRSYRGAQLTSSLDFDSGRQAEIGYFINFAQRFRVNKDIEVGYRLYPTEDEGVGFGVEGAYDFMDTPTSPLYRGEGEFEQLITTKNRGYHHWYHRHDAAENLEVRAQWEQWYDEDVFRDFYYDRFRNRTEPRAFANVTYTNPSFIAEGTLRKNVNGFTRETERLPEAAVHVLERPLADRLYLAFDSVNGYNERERAGDEGFRTVNIARLTYDGNIAQALNVAPFAEFEGTFYSDEPGGSESNVRGAARFGVTAQTRYHKTYDGMLGFSGFKHIVIPSLTYTYQPEPTMAIEDTPFFDALDNAVGRSRLEGKVAHIVLGRDGETGETWQVGRASFYTGRDFSNEIRESSDYEVELDVRPRPWYGWQLVGERHSEDESLDFTGPFALEQSLIRLHELFVEPITDEPLDRNVLERFRASRGDFERVLTQLYFEDAPRLRNWNGRVGFAYTKTREEVFNREVLYGLGYRLSDKWSLAFEHRYDFERDDLVRQTYRIRRDLECVAWSLNIEDRESGLDLGFEFSITSFPGTNIGF